MQLFDMQNNEIVFNMASLALPSFKLLWERDKTKGKDQAIREISYVYYLCDYRSPYADFRDSEKARAIAKDFLKDENWIPDADVTDAIKAYTRHQETTLLRLLKAARKAADAVTDYFEQVTFNVTDSEGNQLFDISEVLRALEKIGAVVKNLSALEIQVKKEQLENSSIRGGGDLGDYENPRRIEGLDDIIN